MKICILGCGGTGIKRVMSKMESDVVTGADISVVLVDGSDSDVKGVGDVKDAEVWLAPATDGAGKIRGSNADVYLKFIRSKFKDIPKADLYVVAFSTMGGSGSVFGPELMLELLKRNERVIGVSTVATNSRIDAINSYNVVKGLAGHAGKSGKPVVMFMENGDTQDEPAVDAAISAALESIIYMASEELVGLDTSDLGAFLDYTYHGVKPGLVELVVTTKPEEISPDEGEWLTTLSIVPDTSTPMPRAMELSNFRGVGGSVALYFATCKNRLGGLRELLESAKGEFDRIKDSHTSDDAFADSGDMEY